MQKLDLLRNATELKMLMRDRQTIGGAEADAQTKHEGGWVRQDLGQV